MIVVFVVANKYFVELFGIKTAEVIKWNVKFEKFAFEIVIWIVNTVSARVDGFIDLRIIIVEKIW